MTRPSPTRRGDTRRKRRPRRRIHKGRLALLCSIAALIVVVVMAVISRACADDLSLMRGGGDFRKPVPQAIERGRSDADKALAAPAGSMERQEAMLAIKAREHKLREAGYGHAADEYINAATDALRTRGAL